MAGVLIVAEAPTEGVSPALRELASEGRRLADSLGVPLVAAVLGGDLADAASLGEQGVERVLVAPAEGAPGLDWLVAAAEAAVQASGADHVLLTHLEAGRELGPALAFRLGGGVVTDGTALRAEGGALVVTKPVYGGSALSEQAIVATPKVATLRPRAFETADGEASRQAAVEPLSVAASDGRVQVLETVRTETSSGPKLKDAKVVVSGGRGLGGPENWHVVEELAELLGGAVGATRAVTDAGWVPASHQVGLTGATVAPDLYITIGISGAVQHVAGITGARNVVAINRDAEANIFKHARYGVVGDWKQIVPAFIERLKQLRT